MTNGREPTASERISRFAPAAEISPSRTEESDLGGRLLRCHLITAQAELSTPCLETVFRQMSAGTSADETSAIDRLDFPDDVTALDRILNAFQSPRGRAFLVAGGVGAGKSHFLAAVSRAVWMEGLSHRVAGDQTQQNSSDASVHPMLLPVPIGLDGFRGTREDLEDVVFRRAAEMLFGSIGPDGPRLSREGFALERFCERLDPLLREDFKHWLAVRTRSTVHWEAYCLENPEDAVVHAKEFARERQLAFRWDEGRSDRLDRLSADLERSGYRGVVIVLDELSLFLASRGREQYHNDVSFLQFLAQQARRRAIWVVASLERGGIELENVEPELRRKLRDRFTSVVKLSPPSFRLVQSIRRWTDRESARAVVEELCRSQSDSARLDAETLIETYPFHPAALECLIRASDRFFSRRRSILRLAAESASAAVPASELIRIDQIYDYFTQAVEAEPDLASVREAVTYYFQGIAGLLPGRTSLALRLIKALAVLHLAGLRRSVRDVAAALEPTGPDSFEEIVERAREILETLRQFGGYVDREKNRASSADVFFLEPGDDSARVLRRRLAVREAELEEDDPLVIDAIWDAGADWMVSLSSAPLRLDLIWFGTVRYVRVERCDLARCQRSDIENLTGWLLHPGTRESLTLLVGEPSRSETQRETFLGIVRTLQDGRAARTVAAWIPASPSETDRWSFREYAAAFLLHRDAMERNGTLDRKLGERLDEQLARRRERARDAMCRLYAEGELIWVDGSSPVGAAGDCLSLRIEKVAASAVNRMLPGVMPRHTEVSARRRLPDLDVLVPSMDDWVRKGSYPVRAGDPVDGIMREVLIPLGVAAIRECAYWPCLPSRELLTDVIRIVGEGIPALRLEQALAKSEWGLDLIQARLLTIVLVALGQLSICDGAGLPVAIGPAALGQAGDWWLQQVKGPSEPEQQQLSALADALGAAQLQTCDWPAIRERLVELKAEASSLRLSTRLESISTSLSPADGAARWATSLHAVREWEEWIENTPLESTRTFEYFQSGDRSAPPEARVRDLHACYTRIAGFVAAHSAGLLEAVRLLTDPRCDLQSTPDLALRRDSLLKAVSRGEEIMARGPAASQFTTEIVGRYRSRYLLWHQETFSENRFAPYRGLENRRGVHALRQLERLPLAIQPTMPDLEQFAAEQGGRCCSSAGLAVTLEQSPVCLRCRLPLGTELELPSPGALDERIKSAIAGVHAALSRRGSHLQRHLERDLEDRAGYGRVVAWVFDEDPGDPGTIDSLFDERVIRDLRRALLAGEPRARSLSQLTSALSGKELTRSEGARLFTHWIDPTGEMGPSDYVRVDP